MTRYIVQVGGQIRMSSDLPQEKIQRLVDDVLESVQETIEERLHADECCITCGDTVEVIR